jgi:hypothetical protein
MNNKITTLAFLVLLACNAAWAQVTPQNGTLNIKIPLINYSDTKSKLNLDVSLNYSGGAGIKVSDQASEIGLGWALSAGGEILRLKVGEADDQKRLDIDEETHVLAGLFNTPDLTVDDGQTKLAWNPTYASSSRHTYYDREVHFDREHDVFMFNIEGRTGKFVLAKDAYKTPLLLEKSGLKIVTTEQIPPDTELGTIAGFVITDENGIRYTFRNRLLSAVLNYVRSCHVDQFTNIVPYPPFQTTSYDVVCDGPPARNIILANSAYVTQEQQYEVMVPKETGYYIADAWYLSEIRNPQTNQAIIFNYDTKQYGANEDIFANTSATDYHVVGGWRKQFSLTISENYQSLKYPRLTSIELPGDEQVEFVYIKDRKDNVGKKSLDEIKYYERGELKYKYELRHGYFYKDKMLDEASLPTNVYNRDIALSLTGLKKLAPDGAGLPEKKFEYYTGLQGSATAIFPQRHTFCRDHWGYYSYSGLANSIINSYDHAISLPPLDEYLQSPDLYRSPTSNIDMLQTGMLKKILNEYGGVTEYEYEPNYTAYNGSNVLSGGLRVKKITNTEPETNAVLRTEYKYVSSSGLSTGDGFEMPVYNSDYRGIWVIPNFKRYKKAHPNLFSFVTSSVPNLTSLPQLGQTLKKRIENKAIDMLLTSSPFLSNVAVLYRLITVLRATGLFTTLALVQNDFKTFTKGINFVNANNYLTPTYSRVEEITTGSARGVDSRNGTTIYNYYSSLDRPLLIPRLDFPYSNRARKISWAYGLPKLITQLDEAGNKAKETEFVYDIQQSEIIDARYMSKKIASPSILVSPDDPEYGEYFTNNSGLVTPDIVRDIYYPIIGTSFLKVQKTRVFDKYGAYNEIVSNMDYNQQNYQVNSTKSINSMGNTIEIKSYFPQDYNMPGTLNNMTAKNIISPTVSSEVWQTKPGGTPELINATVAEFATVQNGDYLPNKLYKLQSPAPVPMAAIGSFDPTTLVRNNNLIVPVTSIQYDNSGQPVEAKELQGNRVSCTIYDYDSKYPIATVNNAGINEVAYTSFETDNPNKWVLGANWVIPEKCPTGNKCLALFVNDITTTITINKDYILSFWATSTDFKVNGGIAPTLTGPTINGWTLYQYRLPAGSASPVIGTMNNYNCKIDELRLYPANATISTSTYKVLAGKTSTCDVNNRLKYFEYDGLGRLVKEKDEFGNVVKTYEYHYKQ